MDRTEIQGVVLDADGGRPLPARVHVESVDGVRHVVESIGGEAVHYRREPAHLPDSPEVHTTLSADPFVVRLPPGEYALRS